MKETYILALDQGTTSSRAILFDSEGKPLASHAEAFEQHFPRPGWVEHDPEAIWQSQLTAMREAVQKSGIEAKKITAIGITNQRETTVVWDRHTGKPIHNAIVWQDRRTAPVCGALVDKGHSDAVRDKTGLVIDPYFAGTKIAWLLDHVPGARKKAEAGDLLAGTIDSWLIYRLTGGRMHATDVTNASRTMLFNIHTLAWDKELTGWLDVPLSILPQVKPSSGFVGESDPSILGAAVPICGVAGDQQAALFGQACFEAGDAKNTYGTGCFMLMNTGNKYVRSRHQLLTTVAWGIGDEIEYALEGSIFMAGAVIQWLRDELKMIDSAPESEAVALSVPDTCGAYLVPAFVGLGAPYWDPYARGMMIGLTRGCSRSHIVRAALESLAYQSRDVLNAMEEDAGIKLNALKVDGGASTNNFLMQFQADILDVPVTRPALIETTAMGAAFLAGLSAGVFGSRDDIRDKWWPDKTFTPHMEASKRTALYAGWKRAVERCLKWDRSEEK
jgi:glycerol kinase